MDTTAPRCPYLAINIPGERPFVVERKLYESAMRGVHITESSLAKQPRGDNGTEIWVLTIKHNGGKVRGTLKFYNLLQTKFAGNYEYMKFKENLADWAARAYRKKETLKNPPTKHQKQVAKLERELKKLYAHQPKNPLLPDIDDHSFRIYEGHREYYARWTNDRLSRKELALVGGWVLKGVITPMIAYKLLHDCEYGVTKFSKVTHSYRQYHDVHSEQDYWKKLYRFAVGLADKRKSSFKETPLVEQLASHRLSLVGFLERKREIDSIKTQIESIQQLAAMESAANETGVVYA